MKETRYLQTPPPNAAQERSTQQRRLVQPLWNALERHVGPRAQGGLLLCVSGGPDSRTLMEAFSRWPARGGLRVEVACVDHHTRPDTGAEAAAVCARAAALGFGAAALPVRTARDDEAALREARLRALVEHARRRGLGALVLAHHRGDVAEGRLLAVLGEGGGNPAPVSRIHDLVVLHPFLELPRESLALARTALGVRGVFMDPERRSARARLREDLLGRLPQRQLMEARLAQDAAWRRDDEDTLLPMAAQAVQAQPDGLWVPHGAPAVTRRALKAGLRALAPAADLRSSSPAVERILDLAAAGRTGEIHLAGGVLATVSRAGVLLSPAAPPLQLAGGPAPAYAAGVTHPEREDS